MKNPWGGAPYLPGRLPYFRRMGGAEVDRIEADTVFYESSDVVTARCEVRGTSGLLVFLPFLEGQSTLMDDSPPLASFDWREAVAGAEWTFTGGEGGISSPYVLPLSGWCTGPGGVGLLVEQRRVGDGADPLLPALCVLRRRGPIPPLRTFRILHACASACMVFHGRGGPHGFVSLLTVFCGGRGDTRAALLELPAGLRDSIHASAPGTLLEAVRVYAPEEVWGSGPSVRTDVFQLGALAVSLLTRRFLKLSDSLRRMGYQAVLDGLYPGRDFLAGVPAPFDMLIARALEPDPPSRHRTMEEFLADLKVVHRKFKLVTVKKRALEEAASMTPECPADGGDVSTPGEDEVAPAVEGADGGVSDSEGVDQRGAASGRSRPVSRGVPSVSPSEAGWALPADLRAVGLGVGLLLIGLVGWWFLAGDGDGPPACGRALSTGDVERVLSSAPPRPAADEGGESRGAAASRPRRRTAKGPGVEEALLATADCATDGSNFEARRDLLRKAYLKLPWVRKRIGRDVFRKLFYFKRRDPESAYSLLDDCLRKCREHLESEAAGGGDVR